MSALDTPSLQDHSEGIAKVENLEQGIIQHVKTSGIRKPREMQLIDEIMDLRRERRKIFATLVQQLRLTDARNSELSSELATLKERQSGEATGLQSQLTALLTQRQADQDRYEEKLQRELAAQEEKHKFMEKVNVDKVKRKCEEKMKLLEAKVDEVFVMKANSDQKEAKAIATELLTKAKAELEKRCSDKINEYVDRLPSSLLSQC